ncbi:endonuclease [bacterium SCSIO 12643]|nr:endonuclease [bacterium SCSIO 12643]
MLRLGLLAVNILIYTNVFGQISDYYQTAFNSSDATLKQELHLIIRNHQAYSYTSSSTDVWDILKQTDQDTVNPNNVILIYSGRSVDAAQEYNGGQGWNREHVWAKSRGDFGTSTGAGTDVHHLRPCDISVNSTRNNRNFDDCVSCIDVVDDGYQTGSKRDANLWTFEPPDAVKGDVARMIFYMAVRYEGNGNEPDLELTNTLLSKSDKNPLQASLTTLLEWHRNDPVSDWERNRNEIIYTKFQKNRNPFIDYPELAEYLWGNQIGNSWNPNVTSILELGNEQGLVYPNPTSGVVNIVSQFDHAILLDQYGHEIKIEFVQGSNDLSILSQGLYVLKLIKSDGQIQYQKILKI